MIRKSDPVIVYGGHGMAGSAICRQLDASGYSTIIRPSHEDLELIDKKAVYDHIRSTQASMVIMAAAKVGGILANLNDQSGFFINNLKMSVNVIEAAHECGVQNLVYLGSSCVYPAQAEVPIKESSLLTGPLEPSNEGYALAKIAAIKLCSFYSKSFGRNYFSVMPTNLYGPGDNYHPVESHVLPALIRRIHVAKQNTDPEVTIWGSGRPYREFMHAEDLARAIVHLIEMRDTHPFIVNIGSGDEVTIAELAKLISDVIGYSGTLRFDRSKPDGTFRKLLDSSYIKDTGWVRNIDLNTGIIHTYADFLSGKGRNILLPI